MSSIPPPAGEPSTPPKIEAAKPLKRPKYLVAALILALAFGAGCWTEGCGRLAYYRGEQDYGAQLNQQIKDDQARARIEGLYQYYVDEADAERGRAIPFAAGIFVLGAALLALAARGLAGRSNTRSALMQVVAAQAIVVAAGYYATKDMQRAEFNWRVEHNLEQQRESTPTEQFDQSVPIVRKTIHFLPPAWLAFRSLASVLILVALSRQRSREFFEAAGVPPVSERG